jgi:hypothetical protein
MSACVLEIGAGSRPAPFEPGSIFMEKGTRYLGIDADEENASQAFDWDNTSTAGYCGRIIVADSAELPITDKSMSHVIMRSVFGEYTMPPEFTGSSLDNTTLGIYEAFRVLQNDGEIVIAEENTPEAPAEPDRIGELLHRVGFDDITIYPCQNMRNPHWVAARTRFWGMDKPGDTSKYFCGKPIDPEWGFLMKATKPETETTTFEQTISIKSAWRANNAHGWDSRHCVPFTRNAIFQKSIRETPLDPDSEDPFGYSGMTVITKDEVTDLHTILKTYRTHANRDLFLL